MRRFSLSSQDDQPPALTGSNRLFQTTTMYIPNSGKSERSKRHVPRSVHVPKSRLFTRRKIKYIVPNNNGNWQRQPRANDRRTAHYLIGTVSRCQTRACARSMRRRRAVQITHETTCYYDSNLNSTEGTDELVTSSNHADHSGAPENLLIPAEKTWQLLSSIMTVIIARFVVST